MCVNTTVKHLLREETLRAELFCPGSLRLRPVLFCDRLSVARPPRPYIRGFNPAAASGRRFLFFFKKKKKDYAFAI